MEKNLVYHWPLKLCLFHQNLRENKLFEPGGNKSKLWDKFLGEVSFGNSKIPHFSLDRFCSSFVCPNPLYASLYREIGSIEQDGEREG